MAAVAPGNSVEQGLHRMTEMSNSPKHTTTQFSHVMLQWLGWALSAALLVSLLLSSSSSCGITTQSAKLLKFVRGRRDSELPFPVTCTSALLAKQSCMFKDVCLQLQHVSPGSTNMSLLAVLHGSSKEEHLNLLQKHLEVSFNNTDIVHIDTDASSFGRINTATFKHEDSVALLWRPHGANHYSFGHALVNEAYAMFMVLQNHYGSPIPFNLQLIMATGPWDNVLRNVYINTISERYAVITELLQPGKPGVCFQQLLVGDGGYIEAGRQSLANAATDENLSQYYKKTGTWYNSNNWWQFRQHVLQLHGLPDHLLSASARPLVLLNDKRYGQKGERDRRMIQNLDEVTSKLAVLYPHAEVKAVRFRDISMKEQIAWWSRATLLITTQASSSFGLVFLPRGATCLMVGNPLNVTDGSPSQWESFFELDVWFPLTYVHFLRYEIRLQDSEDYKVNVIPGHYEPAEPQAKINWWLYNADVKLDIGRLISMVDPILNQSHTKL